MIKQRFMPALKRFFLRRLVLRWLGLMLSALLLVLICHLPAVAETPKDYTDLQFTPLSEIQIPEYERYQLDNGLVVYLMEDHTLPLVSGQAIIRTGSRLEPSQKTGLAEITGTVMRSGGTQQHPAAELNALLEQRAASIETGIDTTAGSASFNAISEDLEMVFKLFAEVLRFPAFAPDQLALAMVQKRGEIARRNDDPGEIASREFEKLVYGEDSPYARTVEYETLENIARDDVVDFHAKYFHPDRTILGVVGDFDPQAMKALIQKAFGNWQAAPENLPSPPATSQKYEDSVFLVQLPQLTQSNVLLGHIGGRFDSPDYPELSVLNSVLNGFGGRLFNEVRSRQGLAYSVYGVWSPRYDYPGLFIAGGQTRTEATVPFVKLVLSELEQLRTTPITEEELNFAKESILNAFVFNFDQPGEILSRLMRYEYFGYPEDFIFQYQREVEATTIEDVLRVAQTHLQPKQIVTLVVGNAEGIQPPLTSLGTEIRTVDISLNQP